MFQVVTVRSFILDLAFYQIVALTDSLTIIVDLDTVMAANVGQ